jgi:phosphate starvation-inducible protein PhoH and related proteins
MLAIVEEPQRRLTKREKRLLRQQGADTLVRTPSFDLMRIRPKTDNQQKAFQAFYNDKHLFLHGTAGTGKTFIAFYLALQDLHSGDAEQNKVFVVRSTVPSRDMGFLPGNQKDKMKVYEQPYYAIASELYGRGDAYDILKQKNIVEFISTSFIRGTTLSDCFVIVDECQNMDFGELNTIITRAGENARFIFCGDFRQDDLTSKRYNEESGIKRFMNIIQKIDAFEFLNFTKDDIVRSELVKQYIIASEDYGGLTQ